MPVVDRSLRVASLIRSIFSGCWTVVAILAMLLASCGRYADVAPESPTTSTSSAPPSPVASRPAGAPPAVASSPQFHRLSPTLTGVDFVNPLDTRHPLKRLYVGGFGCGGVAIGDVNGDDRPDLYLVSGPGENRLFLQEEAFRFRDVTSQAGVDGGPRWGAGASLADVDNDADLDLFVCNYDAPNQLFINRGDGTFTEEAGPRGVDVVEPSLAAAFCDFDRDGDLDFYLLTYRFYRAGGRPAQAPLRVRDGKPEILPEFAKYYRLQRDSRGRLAADAYGRPDRLYRNDGSGHFSDVTQASGISGPGYGNSATWWDYDRDGWPDLYVGNDFNDPDRLYRNHGDGTFTDVLVQTVPHTSWFSMGADCGDLNNDGLPDLLSLDMAGSTHFLQKTTMGQMNARKLREVAGPPPQIMRNALLINSGGGRFLEGAYLAGLANSDWSWSVKLADLDNDGLLDVFISNGMSRSFNNSDLDSQPTPGQTEWEQYENTPTRPEQNLAFRNAGQLEFHDASHQWGLDHVGMSYAVALGDLDRDGDLDLVVANLDEPVSIYRNDAAGAHWLLVRLKGIHSNSFGFGARVTIETADGLQVRELNPMTGFVSSNEPLLHFGLGACEQVNRLEVRWPSGHVQQLENLATDQVLTVTEPTDAAPPLEIWTPLAGLKDTSPQLFEALPYLEGLRHVDQEYDDFRVQPLLPNKLSQLGPGIASGDVDQDGDVDFFFGQGAGVAGALLLNTGKGDFQDGKDFIDNDPASEDLGSLLFDADGDGDLDLYVVSGSVQCEPGNELLRDRLYVNDGHGKFSKAPIDTLPDVVDSGSCVLAADFDRDGDLDLFVGSRVVPGKYPLAPDSRLLRNDSAAGNLKFRDVTDEVAPGLRSSGMVTGGLWSDADGDGWVDLLVTHEWGPVKLWHNDQGRLSDQTHQAKLADRVGWWNGIAGRDLDGDGDIDYVVTNFGINTKYHASPHQPALLYYGDFEARGKYRLVEAEYEDETLFPIRGKSCSTRAMPFLGDKFQTYHDFALAPLQDLYTPKCLADAHRFAATELESGVLINDGAARFEFRPLPRLAQISPGFGVVLTELDGDGHSDCYVVQNFYTPQPETGRMDGGLSLLLNGNGDGSFTPVWPHESGLVVPGDAKSLVATDLNDDGWPDFVVGVNSDQVLTLVNRHPTDNRILNVRLQGAAGNPDGIGASVTLTTDDGSTQTAEVSAGSGYLSQSTTKLTFGLGDTRQAVSLQVRWPDGEVSNQEITDSSGHVIVEQP